MRGVYRLPLLRELPWCSCVLQSVVVPRCRGTAEALQITVGHILGDAGSPYLTGLVRPGGGLGCRHACVCVGWGGCGGGTVCGEAWRLA